MFNLRCQNGITLIETLTAVVVLGVLVAASVPSFNQFIQGGRLKGALESVFANLQYAKSEAIKRNQQVYLTFTEAGDTWCYGLTAASGSPACTCDTTARTTTCEIATVYSDDYKNITIDSSTAPTSRQYSFNPIRGSADSGNVTLSNGTYTLRVVISSLGRIKICSPDNAGLPGLTDYPGC